MTNLSPAAQAVASAYDDTPEKDTGNHRYLWLAAALRAAADHLSYQLPFEDFGRIDVVDLLAIADELEGVKHGTYRCDLKVLSND
jgi:hypothetical protein